MQRNPSLSLDVLLNDQPVGTYTRYVDGRLSYGYVESWLSNSNAIPVSLSLPLQETPYTGDKVNAVFENLLPDNDTIRRRLAERMGAAGTDAFSLLAKIGRDCVGALQFVPSGEAPPSLRKIRGSPVNETEIAKTLRDLAQTPLGLAPQREFRISVAGAQDKTAFLRLDGAWYRPSGTTPTSHIFKPSIGMLPNGVDLIDSVENEWLCLQLARHLGLAVAKAEMTSFDDVRALVVERFDRQPSRDGSWILRRPQEDMLQALGFPPNLKYENEGGPGIKQIMDLLRGSDRPEEDRLIFLRAQIVFWLLGATDGHAKNFSIFLGPQGSFRLTPLYDIMSVEQPLAPNQLRWREAKLTMAVGDNRHRRLDQIVRRHWEQTAKRCGVSINAISGILADLTERCESLDDTLNRILPDGFPARVVDPVAKAIAARSSQLT